MNIEICKKCKNINEDIIPIDLISNILYRYIQILFGVKKTDKYFYIIFYSDNEIINKLITYFKNKDKYKREINEIIKKLEIVSCHDVTDKIENILFDENDECPYKAEHYMNDINKGDL